MLRARRETAAFWETNKEAKLRAGAARYQRTLPLTWLQQGTPLLLTQPCLACSLSLSILSTPPPPSGLSSFSVIDSNGRRIERKKFRREFRRRAHQPPPLNVKPPVVFQAPILILSPRINRTDGAFPDIYGPAQKYHWFTNLPLYQWPHILTCWDCGDVNSIPRLSRSILARTSFLPLRAAGLPVCAWTPRLDQDVTKSQGQTLHFKLEL